jgi:fatty-acyl-CoA synthase
MEERSTMLSTMQDTPMSIGQIVRYGTTAHADSAVVTWEEHGPRSISFGEVGRRAAQLAHGLRSLGIDGDQRVATFEWNNSAHLQAYLAVPAMGAALHTLHIRLLPEQLVHHTPDKVAERIVGAEATKKSTVPVTPEAHVAYHARRFLPAHGCWPATRKDIVGS